MVQSFFGMKVHVGVDATNGMAHSVTATSSNVNDIVEAHKLIRKDDDVVYRNAGYQGAEKRREIKEDECLSKKEYRICKRYKKVCYKGLEKNPNRLFILFASVNLLKYTRAIR